ncbi:uncharacterized protein LOC111634005 [Centruroides sculpturatus]|uniref:uncharacterized protein LOC111634005 n=1 Tax=Centruroides sculpturatus TaxID=218467 RepID=UPI000C6D29DE|nr:uncharacterized protein LOC111634005 [Centruroides sculpturatus]
MWKVNIIAILKDLILEKKLNSLYPIKGTFYGDVLVIHGIANYVLQEDYEQLRKQFPNVKIFFLENCAHWIHLDKTEKMLEIIIQHLLKN